MPTAAVIVVNWDGAQHLPGCLSALAAQTYRDFAVWAVDNGSVDGSRALLAEASEGAWPLVPTAYRPDPPPGPPPALRLLVNAKNEGFAAANNRAFEAAMSDPDLRYLVPLNNDTVAHPDWLGALVAVAEADPGIGSVASTMLFASQPDRVASAGISAHRDGLMLDAGVGRHLDELPRSPQPVFGASAGAALYRREMLEDVGLFDPAFFSYLEDADLAWRARLRGWRAAWVPSAHVLHAVSATGVQGSAFKNYHLARNRIWCIAKNMPDRLLASNLPYILGYDLPAIVYGLLHRDLDIVRGRRDALRDLSRVLAQRREIQAARTVPVSEIARRLSPPLSKRAAVRARADVDALLG
ncbi:MAG: glycosyltransferase family 2 protein [Chloroflexia bacterium]